MIFNILQFAGNLLTHWRNITFKVIQQLAVLVQQKFVEVPFDLSIQYPVFGFAGQPFVDGVHVIPFYRDLGCHGEANPKVLFTKFFDLFITAGFLSAKIIGGKPTTTNLSWYFLYKASSPSYCGV